MAKAKPTPADPALTDPAQPDPVQSADAQAPTLNAADLISAAGGGAGGGGVGGGGGEVKPTADAGASLTEKPGADLSKAIDDQDADPGVRLAAVRERLKGIGDPYTRRAQLIAQRNALLDEAQRSKKAYEDRIAQVTSEYHRENERATMADGQRQRLLQLERRLVRELERLGVGVGVGAGAAA